MKVRARLIALAVAAAAAGVAAAVTVGSAQALLPGSPLA
jgi:hypothetical protein